MLILSEKKKLIINGKKILCIEFEQNKNNL